MIRRVIFALACVLMLGSSLAATSQAQEPAYRAYNRVWGLVLSTAGFHYPGDFEHPPCAGRGDQPVPTRMMVWLA